MRRTDEEFKAEVYRRSEAWRIRRSKRRKMIAALCLPILLCGAAWMMLMSQASGGASDSANMEADMAVSEECMEAPAAAAPEEAVREESITDGSGCTAVILSVEVRSQPEAKEYDRHFTDPDTMYAIADAIQEFCDDGNTIISADEPGDSEGMAYRILITEERIVREYYLFNDALNAGDTWYINADRYRQLVQMIYRQADWDEND